MGFVIYLLSSESASSLIMLYLSSFMSFFSGYIYRLYQSFPCQGFSSTDEISSVHKIASSSIEKFKYFAEDEIASVSVELIRIYCCMSSL